MKQQILFLLCLSLVACSSQDESPATPSLPEVDNSNQTQEETSTEESPEENTEEPAQEKIVEEEPEVEAPPLPDALVETAIGDISTLSQAQASAFAEIIYSENQGFLTRQSAYNAGGYYKFTYDGPMYAELLGNDQGEAGLLIKHWDFDTNGLDVIHVLYYLWDGANIYEVDDVAEFTDLVPDQSALLLATLLEEYATIVVE